MGPALGALKILFRKTRAFLWDVICLFYVFVWGIKSPVRQALTTSAGIVLLTSSLVFLAEMLALFHHELLANYDLKVATGDLSQMGPLLWLESGIKYLDSLPWLRTIVDFLTRLLWVKIAILLFGAWMVRHRWQEMRQHKRALVLATSVRGLFEDMTLTKIAAANSPRDPDKIQQDIEKVLFAFSKPFDGKARFRLNIMEPVPPDLSSLKITQMCPKHNDYDEDFKLLKGQGCAGTAYEKNGAIYVPSRWFEYGIPLTEVEKQSNGSKTYPLKKSKQDPSKVYYRSKKQPFRSIISVPVRTINEPDKVLAVLNIDSAKQNAFGLFEQESAYVAASAIAMILS